MVIACSLFVLQGCSKKLDGDIFVLNNDGSSKKLPLVDVYAVQLNALIEFEKVANIKRDKDKADVMTTFASLDLKGLNEQHLAVTKGETDLLSVYEGKYKEALGLAKRLGDGLERSDAYRNGQYRMSPLPQNNGVA